jgi:hypothetical protein
VLAGTTDSRGGSCGSALGAFDAAAAFDFSAEAAGLLDFGFLDFLLIALGRPMLGQMGASWPRQSVNL